MNTGAAGSEMLYKIIPSVTEQIRLPLYGITSIKLPSVFVEIRVGVKGVFTLKTFKPSFPQHTYKMLSCNPRPKGSDNSIVFLRMGSVIFFIS